MTTRPLWILTLLTFLSVASPAAAQVVTAASTITTSGADCSVASRCAVLASAPSAGGTVVVAGTFTGTVQFEGTVDDASWFPVYVTPLTGGAAVTSATAAGQWTVGQALLKFRVRASALSGGTPVVTMLFSIHARGQPGSGSGSSGIVAGTINCIPKYLSASTVGNSLLCEDGTDVTITNAGRIILSAATLEPVTAGGLTIGTLLKPVVLYASELHMTGAPPTILPLIDTTGNNVVNLKAGPASGVDRVATMVTGGDSYSAQAMAASGSLFLTGFGTDGVYTRAQPAFTNLTGAATLVQGGTTQTTAPDDNVLIGSGTAWELKALPNCPDTGGNHLNYTTATNALSCGTSGGGSGAPTTAEYWVATADATLSAERNLGLLTTGLVLNTVTAAVGVPSTYAGAPGVANQFLRSLTASGVGTSSAVSLTLDVTGVLGGTNGGTAQSTTTQGDLLFGAAGNTWSKLAKNASATRYLSNTGTSNDPAWAQVALATGVSGTLPVANGGDGTRLFSLGTCTGTIAIDWANGSTQVCETTTGNTTFTMANPVDGMRYAVIMQQDGTGSRTATWPADVNWPSTVVPTTSGASKVDVFSFIYRATGTSYYGVAAFNFAP